MENGMWSDNNYFVKSLKKLVGYTIVQALQDKDPYGGQPYFGVLVQKGADKRAVWFLCDEEDNGAGFFDIEPMFEDNELKGI